MNAKVYLLLFTLITYATMHSMETPSPEELESFALYHADLNDDTIIYELLDQGLNPNAKDSGSKMSLLHYAAKNGNLSLSETLLKHPKFIPANVTTDDLNENGNYIGSPFQLALEYKHLTIAKHILTIKDIDPNKVLDIYKRKASDSNIDILTDILSLNIDRQKLSEFLFSAAGQGQISLVTLLLNQKNIDVNYRQQFYGTTLCQAALTGNMPILKLLIEHGAQFPDALSCAINRGNVHSVRFLLDEGAPFEKDERGDTLLAQAIKYTKWAACARIMQLLLAKGADVNEIADKDGNVPLGLIAHRVSCCHEAIKVLLAQPDIKVDIKNNDGKTPLDIAYEVRKEREDSLDKGDWDSFIDQLKQHKKA